MDSSISSVVSDSAETHQQRFILSGQWHKGAQWFFWIAGLSLLNSLINLGGSHWNFLAGLGITQVIDAIASEVGKEVSARGSTVLHGIALVLDLGIGALFMLFGFLARRGYRSAFIIGLTLYGLDALLLLALGIWVSLAFHLFALFQIFIGVKALYQFRRLVAAEARLTPGQII